MSGNDSLSLSLWLSLASEQLWTLHLGLSVHEISFLGHQAPGHTSVLSTGASLTHDRHQQVCVCVCMCIVAHHRWMVTKREATETTPVLEGENGQLKPKGE